MRVSLILLFIFFLAGAASVLFLMYPETFSISAVALSPIAQSQQKALVREAGGSQTILSQDTIRGWKQRITNNESIYYNISLAGNLVTFIRNFPNNMTRLECGEDPKNDSRTICKNVTYFQPDTLRTRFGDTDTQLTKDGNVFTFILDPLVSLLYKFGLETVILEADPSYGSNDTNVTQENGFAHLNITTDPPYDKLVLYMPFDTNTSQTTINDYSHFSNDDTINGDVDFNESGAIGGAMTFQGAAGDFILVPDSVSMSPEDEIAISVWFSTASTTSQFIIDKRTGGADGYEMLIGSTDMTFSIDTGTKVDATSTNNFTDGNWHHFVGSWDGSRMLLFVDNILLNNVSQTGEMTDQSDDARIGIAINEVSNPMNGAMDEVMIFNSSLTVDQVSDIFNNQSSRFANIGNQTFRNTNVSTVGDENTLNVTLQGYRNLFNSNISVEIEGVSTNLTADGNATGLNFTVNPSFLNITFVYSPGIGGGATWYTPLLIGNITLDSWNTPAVGDTEFPSFTVFNETPLNNSVYSLGTNYRFNVTVNNTNGTVGFDFDGVNHTASNLSTNIFNVSIGDLSAGTFRYAWWGNGNGTDENLNSTLTKSYVVQQATGDVEVYLNDTTGNITIELGGTVTFNVSRLAGEGTFNVTNDGTVVGAGNFTTNTTTPGNTSSVNITGLLFETTNYTSEFLTRWIDVQDTISPKIDYIAPTEVDGANITADAVFVNVSVTELDFKNITFLLFNDTGIINSTSFLTETFELNFTSLAAGNYTYNVSVFDNSLNTNSTANRFINISAGAVADNEFPIFSVFNETPLNNSVYSLGTNYRFNVTVENTNGSVGFDFDGVNRTASNLSASIFNISIGDLSAGTFRYAWFSNGNGTDENFNHTLTRSYVVRQATGDVEVYLDDTTANITVEVGATVTFNGSRLAGEGIFNISQDGTVVGAGNFTTNTTTPLTLDSINITAELFETTNFTSEFLTRFIDVEDTVAPEINITSPVNGFNSTDTQLDVDFTVSDLLLQSCFYSFDDGATNITITCGDNITSQTWNQGQNNVTVTANDTSNNMNNDNVSFTIDSFGPAVNITNPLNNTNHSVAQLDVTFTVSDSVIGLQACFWTNSSGLFNTTITCGNNVTGSTWPEGNTTIDFFANDTLGNQNSTSTLFLVDTIFPKLNFTIGTPVNDTSIVSDAIFMNVTLTEINFINITYEIYNDTGGLTFVSRDTFSSKNISVNFSGLANDNVTYFFNVSTIDVVNNTNSTETRTVTLITGADNTPPTVTDFVENPTDPANYTNGTLYRFNVTVTDNGSSIQTVILIFDGVNFTATNVGGGDVYNATVEDLGVATYDYNWFANDTEGNFNDTEADTYTVNQAPGFVQTFIDGAQANKTITASITNNTNMTGVLVTGVGNISLYINDTLSANSTSPIVNFTNFTKTGTFDINVTYFGNVNFTAAFELFTLTVVEAGIPRILITFPERDALYSGNMLDLNVTSPDTVLVWRFSFDEGISNTTFTPNTSLSFNVTQKNVTVTVFGEGSVTDAWGQNFTFFDFVVVNEFSTVTNIYIFGFLLALTLIVFGYAKDKYILRATSGMLFIVLALEIGINRIAETGNDLITNTIAIILAGLGIFFITSEPLKEYLSTGL